MAYNIAPISGLFAGLHVLATTNTDPTDATLVAELTEIGDMSISREMADYHTYQDEWMKKVATTLSVDDIDLEGVYIASDTSQEGFASRLANGAQTVVAITYGATTAFTTGTKIVFNAFVSNFSSMSPIDDKVAFKVTLSITGEVVITPLS